MARKKGSINKSRAELVKFIRQPKITRELLENMMQLARGIRVEGENGVYDKPPDYHANAWLLDQAYGKATQTHEVTGEDGGPMRFIIDLKE